MPSTRPTLYGSRHAVSAGHYLAAAAGFAILEAGGNAIDAGCAAGIALAVLHPDEVNVAGVAPIMIRTGQGKVVTIAGLGHWPKRLPADLFMREHGGKMPLGILRTVVPAAPDAWITALTDYGTMSFGDVAGAAVRYAREGFAVFEYMATMIKQYEDGYRSWPSNAAIFLPGGKLPQVGDRFVQSDLAGTLQYMIDQERAAAASAGGWPASPPRAPPSIAATSPRRSCATTSRTAAISRATTSRTSTAATRSRCRCAGATSRSSPAGRGARARCWPRRCA